MAFLYSDFVHHFVANRNAMPPAEAEAIRREATGRVKERWLSGPAFTPLEFDDLVQRIERAVMPKGSPLAA